MTYGFKMTVPDGSLGKPVHDLLAKAGVKVSYRSERSYEGVVKDSHLFPPPHNVVVRMRPQDATWLVADGRFHLGFAGHDLIAESDRSDELEVLREYPVSRGGVGKTRVVVAVHAQSGIQHISDIQPHHELVTEYPRLAQRFLHSHKLRARVRRCHGATEAFGHYGQEAEPIAHLIVENVETGTTLREGGWREIFTVLESRLCVFAAKKMVRMPEFRQWADELLRQIDSVVAAWGKVMLKFNVTTTEDLERILRLFEGKTPTVSGLAGRQGHAVEVLVEEVQSFEIMSKISRMGANSILPIAIDRLMP